MSDERVYGVRWFVPGTPATLDEWDGSLRRAGLALEGEALRIEGSSLEPLVEWIENDGSFGDAFGFGTVTEEERRAIDRAGSALVLEGACVMMAHADVKSLERSRGYVDLEPELAWEQWELLRGAGR